MIKTEEKYAQLRTIIPEMRRVKRIHFVGIGGAGMGGIAEVLVNEVIVLAVPTSPRMP